MKTTFVLDGHKIVVIRELAKMELFVDGICHDSVKGIFAKDKDAVLNGIAVDDDGSNNIVCVEYKSGGLFSLFGELSLMYNNKLIDVRNTL